MEHSRDHSGGSRGGGPASLEARPHLGADGGTSAESDTEQWSDQGWAAPPRQSLSSSDEPGPSFTTLNAQPPPSHVSSTTSTIPPRTPHGISFSSTADPHRHTVSHRRHSSLRQGPGGLHTASSDIALDTMAHPSTHGSNGTSHRASALARHDMNMDNPSPDILAPSPIINGYSQPPPGYGEATTTSAYVAGYPTARARGKSLSHATHTTAPPPASTSEDDGDDAYLGGLPPVPLSSKTKARKRSRGGSFSLPFHRRRRSSNSAWHYWWPWNGGMSRGPRYTLRQYAIVACILLALWYAVHLWRSIFEIQVEFSVFSHKWIRSEIDSIQPLRGCFDPAHISPWYNLTQHQAGKRQLLSPGISLRRGMSCYDFAATVQPLADVPLSPVTYHTYWRSDLIPFGTRQTATFQSFLATQPLSHSKLILWTNGADIVSANSYVKPYLDTWGDYIEVRQVDMASLARGTELEGILSAAGGGGLFDKRAWVDGDAVRLLVLWHYGGIWMDMDQILTRDLHPLTEQEFVTQWDCYDKPYFSLNGAVLHFHRHSPYLCEAFHIMASSALPKPNTFTWGAHLYSKLHRRLIAGGVRPFTVLPWCFTDPRNCRSDIRFPDPFAPDPDHWGGRRWDGRGEVGLSGRELLEENMGYVWSLHLHNQWRRQFPKGGWVERLLDCYSTKVAELEEWMDNTRDGVFGFLDIINFLLGQSAPPHVLTTSYGSNEADVSRAVANNLCNAYAQLGARGTSILFSSGDGGVSGTQDGSCTTFVPSFPSGCPFLTSVGATQGVPETTATFSSGGFSNYFGIPSYQAADVASYLTKLGNTDSGRFNRSGRAFPDVSAQGVNVEIVFQNQAGLVDGTSCSSPIFASVIAMLNDELVAAGKSPLGFLNPFLYSTGASALADITTGSNPGCGTNGFPALAGWDPATGLGTPIFASLRTAVGL